MPNVSDVPLSLLRQRCPAMSKRILGGRSIPSRWRNKPIDLLAVDPKEAGWMERRGQSPRTILPWTRALDLNKAPSHLPLSRSMRIPTLPNTDDERDHAAAVEVS